VRFLVGPGLATLVSLAAIARFTLAIAQPSVPATFYGSVTIDGAPADAGLEVRGFVNGVDCSQSPPGERLILRDGTTAVYVLYVVHESQRAGCARDGSTVTFTIDGRSAVQTGAWKPGPLRLDLSTGSAPPIPLPSPTGTVAAALETAQVPASSAVATGTLSRPTGTPPTDDVRFERTPVPGGTPQAPVSGDDSDGGSGVAVVLGVLAVLAIAGGGLGIVFARRQRARGA
jgi:hypothetical protein